MDERSKSGWWVRCQQCGWFRSYHNSDKGDVVMIAMNEHNRETGARCVYYQPQFIPADQAIAHGWKRPEQGGDSDD